jgi:flavin-dependent dehydrogenase
VTTYFTDVDSGDFREARSYAGFLALLMEAEQIASRVRTFRYTLDGPLHSVAAHSSRLERAAGDGWCAVGDAYATHDPLSSGGILAALESGRQAVEAIASCEGGGMERYHELSADGYARYLAQWLSYYTMESRWPEATFWKRRHDALRDVLGWREPGRMGSFNGERERYGG